MHIISKEQGRAIVTAIVIIALFTILFRAVSFNGKTGILEIGGSAAKTDAMTFDKNTYKDTGSSGNYGKRLKPEIKYKESGLGYIKKGTAVHLLDYFTVSTAEFTAEGETASQTKKEYQASEVLADGFTDFRLEILDIKDAGGNSFLADYQKTDGSMTFHAAGIYTVSYELIDRDQKYSSLFVQVPVEQEVGK